jgi:hypothetical protein
MTKVRLVRALVAVAVAATGMFALSAAPADAIGGTPVGVCIKPSTDWRVPYANGSCPSGFALVHIPSGTVSEGEPACFKVETDVRAPYNQGAQAGTCPSGETLKLLYPGSDVLVCVKPSTDFRAPYNQGAQAGTCPSGSRNVWLDTVEGGAALPTLSINDAIGDQFSTDANASINAAFTVTLSAPSAVPVTVDLATVAGTAVEGNDYNAQSGTLTFAPGVTEQPVAVHVNDSSPFGCEGTLSFVVNLSNPTNATIADGQGQGTILDSLDCTSST